MHSSGSPPSTLSGGSFATARHKRLKRVWGEKKRAGMSFLIVIVFFMVFGLIILTEIVMIEDRSKLTSSISIRHGSFNRFGESVPDYEDVKEEYGIDEAVINRHKDFRQNKSLYISLLLLFYYQLYYKQDVVSSF